MGRGAWPIGDGGGGRGLLGMGAGAQPIRDGGAYRGHIVRISSHCVKLV